MIQERKFFYYKSHYVPVTDKNVPAFYIETEKDIFIDKTGNAGSTWGLPDQVYKGDITYLKGQTAQSITEIEKKNFFNYIDGLETL